jgi:HTH-type transcriptional regulator/antitoxin HipB
MNVDMAKRLADRRRNAGLTQEGLAEKLGVSRQAVSKWECSESSPDTDNLIALAKLYGVSLDELLYAEVTPQNTSPADEASKSATNEEQMRGSAKQAETEHLNTAQPKADRSENEQEQNENEQPEAEEQKGAEGGIGFDSNDGSFHLGPDGIRAHDGKDHVHINWRDGVHVDSKNGDSVHVGWNGIRINSQDYDSLDAANAAFRSKHPGSSSRSPFMRAWHRFPFPLLVILIYILGGVFTAQWGLGLFIFAAIPLYYMVGNLIANKRFGMFLAGFYPLAVICWFLYMAFVLNEPHPAWVMFLTIPLFEAIIGPFSHWYHKRKLDRH